MDSSIFETLLFSSSSPIAALKTTAIPIDQDIESGRKVRTNQGSRKKSSREDDDGGGCGNTEGSPFLNANKPKTNKSNADRRYQSSPSSNVRSAATSSSHKHAHHESESTATTAAADATGLIAPASTAAPSPMYTQLMTTLTASESVHQSQIEWLKQAIEVSTSFLSGSLLSLVQDTSMPFARLAVLLFSLILWIRVDMIIRAGLLRLPEIFFRVANVFVRVLSFIRLTGVFLFITYASRIMITTWQEGNLNWAETITAIIVGMLLGYTVIVNYSSWPEAPTKITESTAAPQPPRRSSLLKPKSSDTTTSAWEEVAGSNDGDDDDEYSDDDDETENVSSNNKSGGWIF